MPDQLSAKTRAKRFAISVAIILLFSTLYGCGARIVHAQTPTALPPQIKTRYFDSKGKPLAGGQLFTYSAGTTSPLATFTDATGTAQNTDPVILDSTGAASVWLSQNSAYKFVLEDANGVIQWTVDNVTVSNSTGQSTIFTGGTILNATVFQNGLSDTGGAVNFSAGPTHTLPIKVGTVAGLPATCTVGEEYFATDAIAGENVYLCSATNTWTQQGFGLPFNFIAAGTNLNHLTMGNGSTFDTTGTAIVNFGTASATTPAAVGAALPATCSIGQIFFNTSVTAGSNIYLCTSTNTWTQVSGSGSSTPSWASVLGGATNTGTGFVLASTDIGTIPWTINCPPGLTVDCFLVQKNGVNQFEVQQGSLVVVDVPLTVNGNLQATAGYALAGGGSITGSVALGTATLQNNLFSSAATTIDFHNAAHTLAFVSGTTAAKPTACTQGEEYFATDATAGVNLFFCTSTNTWTQMTGGGSNPLWSTVQGSSTNTNTGFVLAPTATGTTPWTVNCPSGITVDCVAYQINGVNQFEVTPTFLALDVAVHISGNIQAQNGLAINGGSLSVQGASLFVSSATFNQNIFVGNSSTVDFHNAAHTISTVAGLTASKPATCTAGELYFATDATAGQNLFECATANTWTQQLNSGGGGSANNPGGIGTNLQFRSSSTVFGGVSGSSVDSAGGLNLTPTSDTVGEQLVPTASGFADPFEVFNQTVVSTPNAPTASSVTGGSLGAQTLFAKIVYVDFRGVLTIAGTETASQAVTASHLLTLAAPSPNAVGAAGYIPFVTASGGGTGTETQQVATGNCTLATGLPVGAPAACALSATWTEPTSGIAAGANPPGSNLTRQKAAWFDVAGNLNGLWFSQTLQDQTGANFARFKLFGSTVAMGAFQWTTSAGANLVSLSGSSTLNAICVIGGNPTGTDCPSGSPKLGDLFLTPALTTVAGLASSPPTGTIANVSDGTGATDCTAGGGSTLVTCRFNGSIWAAIGGSGGGGGSVFPVTVSGTVTSGGIPCFTSITNEASSSLMASGVPMLGGGAGACPSTGAINLAGGSSIVTGTLPNANLVNSGATTVNGVSCTLSATTCDVGSLFDTNGNATILSSAATTPVNQITVANAATGAAPSISTTGTDTNIELDLNSKGNLGVKLIGNGASINVGASGNIAENIPTGGQLLINMTASATTTFNCGTTAADKCFTVKEGLAAPTNDQIIEANSSGVSLASFGPSGIFHDAGTQIISAADYTNSTVTPSTVFSWTLPATATAKNYRYSCDITWESTNTTLVGPVFGLNISAAPTQLTGTGYVKSALNSTTNAEAEGYLSNATTGSQTLVTGNAAGVTSTNYFAKIWGTIEGAPTAGSTFIINAASTSGTTATLNIRRGSSCVMTSTN